MENIADSVPEHLKCPICFEIPEGKVFQCKDGHIICGDCYSQLTDCPQCRAPYGAGEGGIRNRLMEGMLDELVFDCIYTESGCKEKLNRKTVYSHIESCPFNILRQKCICKLIGFPDCDYFVREGNTSEAIQHMQHAHKMEVLIDISQFQINLLEFEEQVLKSDNNATGLEVIGRVQWNIILNLKSEGYALLISAIFNGDDESLAWIPFRMDYDKVSSKDQCSTQVDFNISNENGNDLLSLKWTITPVDIFKADQLLPNLYPFRFPVPLLINYMEGGGLKVKCQIMKDNTGAISATGSDHETPVVSVVSISPVVPSFDAIPSAPPLTLPSPRRRRAPQPPNKDLNPESSLAPPYLCGPELDEASHYPQLPSTSSQPGQNAAGRKSKWSSKRDRPRHSRDKEILPKVNCSNCFNLIEKGLFHCLQCINYSVCSRCLKKGEHKHLFASVKTTAQYHRLVRTKKPVIPRSVELPTWWSELDPTTKASLELWLIQNGDKCTIPNCRRREGHVVAVCLECPTKLCKRCWKHGSHNEHIVAVTVTGNLHRKDDVARKFLLHFQQEM